MIVTVTLNAGLDVTYSLPRLIPGASHRVALVRVQAGGKGINVARILQQLGKTVIATGFVGGNVSP